MAVNGGVFGGAGKVSGAVTIGTATHAATLGPGNGRTPRRLSTTSTLTSFGRPSFRVAAKDQYKKRAGHHDYDGLKEAYFSDRARFALRNTIKEERITIIIIES